ncbi:MAG TPA: hypothetical protein DD490_31050 [Acidobacteria bacterium]|nr:hypothetical protein [Acidobacteriota bacterium]
MTIQRTYRSGRTSSGSTCSPSKTRVAAGLLLAGAAVGLPVLVSEVIRRRAEAPQAPRWGRAHRFPGALGEIVFQELGTGTPPFLLLHSFGPGYDASQWRASAERLAENHSVFVPDLPGWGRSETPAGGHLPELYVRALAGFLDRAIDGPAMIVAAGLSAAYAVRIALEHPERVLGLVLVNPIGLRADSAALGSSGAAFLRRLLQVPVVRSTTLDLLTSRASLDHHLRREAYAAPERVDAALLDHHYRASHKAHARTALSALLRGDLWLEVEEGLDQLEVPVLLTWGRTAKAAPVANADLWLRRLPDAQVEVFPGSADLPHVESSSAFCKAVEAFTGRLRG